MGGFGEGRSPVCSIYSGQSSGYFFVTVLTYKLFKNYRNGSRTMNRIIQSITFSLHSQKKFRYLHMQICVALQLW